MLDIKRKNLKVMEELLGKSVKVAFILHPLNISDLKKKTSFYYPFNSILDFLFKIIPAERVKKIFSGIPPHVFLSVKNLRSRQDKKIDLMGIMCGLFPEEVAVNYESACQKVIKAVEFALKKGSNIIVLTGVTSIITSGGEQIRAKINANRYILTTGNALTAGFCVEGILTALKIFGKKPDNLIVSIVGATGDIGSICAKVLSKEFSKTILCSRKISEDDPVARFLNHAGRTCLITTSVKEAVKEADVILLATSSYLPLIDFQDVKSSSIICDVSLPFNTKEDFVRLRPDVFVFDGGKARVDLKVSKNNKRWANFINQNSVYGCIAEGLTLGFEGASKDYSFGKGKISEDNLLSIVAAARENGIELAEFAFHEKCYSIEDLARYRTLIDKY